MDKNKCPKKFLKKKFQKTGIFTFLLITLFPRIYALSLCLSIFEKNRMWNKYRHDDNREYVNLIIRFVIYF